MRKFVEIEYDGVEENEGWEELIDRVITKCFEIEEIQNYKLYICITLTTPEKIHDLNKKFRNVDKETDVLSFPMFEKWEIADLEKNDYEESLGDIVISTDQVKKQSEEYGHSFERELSYMVVHGFYHLMGEDHIEEEDKIQMRKKEENVLEKLKITR